MRYLPKSQNHLPIRIHLPADGEENCGKAAEVAPVGKRLSCFERTLVKLPPSIMIPALYDLDAGIVARSCDAVDEAVLAINAA